VLPSLEDGGEAEEDEGIVLLSSECGGEVSCLIAFVSCMEKGVTLKPIF
jgi:hypothetical protein